MHETTHDTAALFLKNGDIIIAPDGSRHQVNNWWHFPGNPGSCVLFDTDTGHHFHLSWYEARAHVYAVECVEQKPKGDT